MVGREKENELTNEQRNWEVLEADQNEQEKGLETKLEIEIEKELDLTEAEENDHEENKAIAGEQARSA